VLRPCITCITDGDMLFEGGALPSHRRASDSTSINYARLSFGFTYLHHPRAVLGFEWRRTGRYMPRLVCVCGCVCVGGCVCVCVIY
jgi:hypothetical protein